MIETVLGDITHTQHVDAIVNTANHSLLRGGEVNDAVHQAAGIELLEETQTLGGCRTGEAKLSNAYNLPVDYIIHTVGPIWNGGQHGEAKLLASCYANTLKVAMKHGLRKLAFPSISTGAYHFPVHEAARIAMKTIKAITQKYPDAFDLIVWVLSDSYTKDAYDQFLTEA